MVAPTVGPTTGPTVGPTVGPTSQPVVAPTVGPTTGPTVGPTVGPTTGPTVGPTVGPTSQPAVAPTVGPTTEPTIGPTVGPTSQPVVAPTVGPTTGPTVGPTVGPTSQPVVAPTAGPTVGPTVGPTSQPVVAPTVGPTIGPSKLPTYICPDDVVQIFKVGDAGVPLPDIPIILIEQTPEMIKFALSDEFKELLKAFYVQYHSEPTGDSLCVGDETPGGEDDFSYYTAHCMKNCPITIVDLWGVGDGVASNENAVVPECCKPLDDSDLPVVQYTFKIHCETQCPDDGNGEGRLLASKEDTVGTQSDFTSLTTNGSVDELVVDGADSDFGEGGKDGHFCSLEDYPCGDNGDMVHVCHYSSRLGYQTFCVPEEDSDVLGFFPKDYCGPCVGGYRGSQTS